MRRRDFITLVGGTAAAWPLKVRAQQQSNIRRVGFWSGTSREAVSELIAAFIQGMRDLGYVEGIGFVIESRFADGNYERFPDLAAELVSMKVDVIVTATTPAMRTLQKTTTAIPIVMAYSTDPVGNGFVPSLGHPGGNTTGLASSSDDTSPKQLELLTMVAPHVTRIGLIGNPNTPTYLSVRRNVEAAAPKAGLSVVTVEARSAVEIEDAFQTLSKANAQALLAAGDPIFRAERQKIAELALRSRMPSMFALREYVTAGGLMSYGENLSDFFYRAAAFVDKVFKGTRPGDLPIEQPTRFHLVINRTTANALGLTIPSQLYVFADEVIE